MTPKPIAPDDARELARRLYDLADQTLEAAGLAPLEGRGTGRPRVKAGEIPDPIGTLLARCARHLDAFGEVVAGGGLAVLPGPAATERIRTDAARLAAYGEDIARRSRLPFELGALLYDVADLVGIGDAILAEVYQGRTLAPMDGGPLRWRGLADSIRIALIRTGIDEENLSTHRPPRSAVVATPLGPVRFVAEDPDLVILDLVGAELARCRPVPLDEEDPGTLGALAALDDEADDDTDDGNDDRG